MAYDPRVVEDNRLLSRFPDERAGELQHHSRMMVTLSKEQQRDRV